MLTSLASSNPPLALVLQTIRLRVLLRQHMAAASLSPAKPGRPVDAVQYRSKRPATFGLAFYTSLGTIGWLVARFKDRTNASNAGGTTWTCYPQGASRSRLLSIVIMFHWSAVFQP